MRFAVERQLTVIGEASRKISDEFKKAHTDIPWNQIISLRNIIVHEYSDIKTEKIWYISTERVPELVAAIKPYIPEEFLTRD